MSQCLAATEQLSSDDFSSGFYKIANLPKELQADWAHRMVYRIFLRSPYPAQEWPLGTVKNLNFGLVNEMSLFPSSKLSTCKAHCFMQVMHADRMDTEFDGVQAQITGLNEVERRWSGNENLKWPGFLGGKGAVSVCISSSQGHSSSLQTTPFMLKVSAVTTEGAIGGGEALTIMPLVFGPFYFTSKDSGIPDSDQLLLFHRLLTLPGSDSSVVADREQSRNLIAPQRPAVVIREMPELAIPGKIWDSALFAPTAALAIMRDRLAPSDPRVPRILDLSAGTGVCGIYFAALASRSYTATELVITDLPEALPIIESNVSLNSHLLTTTNVTIASLRWGELTEMKAIGNFDMIIACDLIYEPDLLDVLVKTLEVISQPGRTSVVIGYKQRGLTPAEKAHVWSLLARSFQVERIKDDVGAEGISAEWVGIELWKLWKPSDRSPCSG